MVREWEITSIPQFEKDINPIYNIPADNLIKIKGRLNRMDSPMIIDPFMFIYMKLTYLIN